MEQTFSLTQTYKHTKQTYCCIWEEKKKAVGVVAGECAVTQNQTSEPLWGGG